MLALNTNFNVNTYLIKCIREYLNTVDYTLEITLNIFPDNLEFDSDLFY